MLVAINGNQDRISASHAKREDGPFACPMCCEPVRLHKGGIRIHHFAHLPNATCAYGAGESEAHRKAKQAIHSAFWDGGIVSILEAPLGDVRPDVMAIIDNEIVAIEVQASTIGLEEITRRTLAYTQRGMAIAWVICDELPAENELARFRWQQRFLHGLYYGRVYYHVKRDCVLPIHLRPSYQELYIDEYGKQHGYFQHKTLKYPLFGNTVSLSDPASFRSIYRKAWSYTYGDTQINYPAAKLWVDTLDKWWDNE